MDELKMIAFDELLKDMAILNEKADRIISLLERDEESSQNAEKTPQNSQGY